MKLFNHRNISRSIIRPIITDAESRGGRQPGQVRPRPSHDHHMTRAQAATRITNKMNNDRSFSVKGFSVWSTVKVQYPESGIKKNKQHNWDANQEPFLLAGTTTNNRTTALYAGRLSNELSLWTNCTTMKWSTVFLKELWRLIAIFYLQTQP